MEAAQYPAHWEADVVLSDGGTAHVRPIRPADADRLRSFYGRLSNESIYFRFFSPRPRLSDREITWFTNVDYVDRVALIATIGAEMVAVISYDRIEPGEAEVAFLVEDAHQGRGVASVLLEHLAATARERGIACFVADVLPANQKMMGVLKQVGYTAQSSFADGVVRMTLDLTPTETAQEVTTAREHRAESRSIERLLSPGSVAVVGAGREPGGVGQTVLRNLLGADFTGPVYPVHREVRAVAGVRAYPSVTAIDGEVDLAVLAVPADGVIDVVKECAEKGVRGLIVVSSGFGEAGPEGRARQDEMVRIARAYGLRVVGPNCLGIANTDPSVRLNATLAATLPGRGRVGFFSQSGALGAALLQRVAQRGMGISSFVSAGNRADVSGNDLLQYWEEDPRTDVILLYLESLGNPRKFARLARRISRRKPIVVVKSGGTTQGVPTGHAAPVLGLPDPALSALFEQAGVIRVDDLIQQFDVAQLLAYQPLPAGPRVGLVSNSDAMALLAADACARVGLEPRPSVNLGARAGAAEFGAALASVLPDVDAVVAIYMPPIPGNAEEVGAELLRVSRDCGKPVLATFEGKIGMLGELRVGTTPERGSIPSYTAPEEAVRALAHVVRHARWLEQPAGVPEEIEGVDTGAARSLVLAGLGDAPAEIDASRLLARYGVEVWPSETVGSPQEAVDAATRLGWPVVLKAEGSEAAKHAGTVRLGLSGPDGVRDAYADLTRQLEPGAVLAVQRMAPQPAVPTVAGVMDDPAFGAVVSFGLGEITARLLHDEAYRLAPLTREDAAALVRSPRAAPLLLGEYGYPPVAVEALEDLLIRLGRLADDLPEVARLTLDPVLVGQSGVTVLGARVVLRDHEGPRPDDGPRRLG
ncbi:bifunctional GNAT family N-acetyltransferase/acetate--CoA ligase family protein [Streptosporangium sp. NBC_01755]|uniref:bifunctional acetate--CoA ligase family protein/GNAT family N-acetyltransferase n=1 Tax=unclassified Streptosporangium TaxID=2632669 RepID=UPI002DD95511|nr:MULTISPECIES: bifunctional GNAT family N-acetyltransferase/acetate--CoA ligase family protein [unclassified Streptosporangium]WSA27185.1 bifunctional GNAT family N-acetyltransferase/acetate--CoA ligase family protein [Streptosporangium sp. NBC_01810]WSD01261.1 bifunctional GNAT family N-acetyltransferase/acetate--CoA ligase family protein [Streptosporangium sp. NBC_01755]